MQKIFVYIWLLNKLNYSYAKPVCLFSKNLLYCLPVLWGFPRYSSKTELWPWAELFLPVGSLSLGHIHHIRSRYFLYVYVSFKYILHTGAIFRFYNNYVQLRFEWVRQCWEMNILHVILKGRQLVWKIVLTSNIDTLNTKSLFAWNINVYLFIKSIYGK